jgi:DNA polymerase (family X)
MIKGMKYTNREIAELFRKVAAVYQVTGENRFKIIAYERAADSIEHLTSELKDLWDNQKLDEVPGLGQAILGHLDELFKTGKVKHFESVISKLPPAFFILLSIPGLGPKKADKLVHVLNLFDERTAVNLLEKAGLSHKIAEIEGFGEKSEADILINIALYRKGAIKENRMNLADADAVAQEIINFLKQSDDVKRVDVLGSLRRKQATIGDIDISAAANNPENVIAKFLKFPHQKMIEKGPTGASVLLHNGRQVDLRVLHPNSYGSMLQYFTGSKNHNIKLRSLAQTKGLSLNEYGIKNTKTGKTKEYTTEESFYTALSLPYVPPELREDTGEIEAARKNQLPNLIEIGDIKGDLHLHTNYNLEPSHDLGTDSLDKYLNIAENYKYEYIGLNDHNPSVSNHTQLEICQIMKRRKEFYEHEYYSYKLSTKCRVQKVIMCEVDILSDGQLGLPVGAFDYVDAVIISVHSSFSQDKSVITSRVVNALKSNPKIRILGHPTGRLLGQREEMDLDWEKIFSVCRDLDIALEINSSPSRLDLPDILVREAIKAGVKLIIDTDAHAARDMSMMPYGVSVARRGWAEKNDIVNTLDYNSFKSWLIK